MTIRGSDEGVRLAASFSSVSLKVRPRPPLLPHICQRKLLATRNRMTRKASVLWRSAASFGVSRSRKCVSPSVTTCAMLAARCNLPSAALEARSSCSSAYTHGRSFDLAPLF